MTTLSQLYSFSFNGYTFGGANSPHQIQNIIGLESLPGIRSQDDNRGYADGMFSGRDFFAGRTISIVFNTFESPGASAQTNYNTIQSYLLPQQSGTTPLYFKFPNSPTSEQVVFARVRSMTTNIDPNYTYGYITSQVDFFCPDPNYYNNNLQTAVMAVLPAVGRTYDRVYDLVYGGATGYITTTVNNIGWATTYPNISLVGPITNPLLGNLTTGEFIQITGSFNLLDTINIDLYNKLITLNGNPARNLFTSGNWFSAQPGNNTFYFNGTFTVANQTKATVTWRSAYV
jgi:phage-related protein